MIDIIGYLAAIITFAGFLTNNVKAIRQFSLLACLIWTIYGLYLGSGSIVLCNVVIGLLQIFKLKKIFDNKKIKILNKIDKDLEYLIKEDKVGDSFLHDQIVEKIKLKNKIKKNNIISSLLNK